MVSGSSAPWVWGPVWLWCIFTCTIQLCFWFGNALMLGSQISLTLYPLHLKWNQWWNNPWLRSIFLGWLIKDVERLLGVQICCDEIGEVLIDLQWPPLFGEFSADIYRIWHQYFFLNRFQHLTENYVHLLLKFMSGESANESSRALLSKNSQSLAMVILAVLSHGINSKLKFTNFIAAHTITQYHTGMYSCSQGKFTDESDLLLETCINAILNCMWNAFMEW